MVSSESRCRVASWWVFLVLTICLTTPHSVVLAQSESSACALFSGAYFRDACVGPTVTLYGTGSFSFDTTLCGAANDFDLGPGNPCTGTATPGPDLRIRLYLYPNGPIEGCYSLVRLYYCVGSTPFDGAVYVVDDCGNPLATCLDGSDDDGIGVVEDFALTLYTGRAYTFIVDSRDALCGRFGFGVIVNLCYPTVATDQGTWGAVKRLFY